MSVSEAGVAAIASLALVASCGYSAGSPTIEVEAEGLAGPVGLALLPDGSLFVAEEGSGDDDDSAGVSLIRAGVATKIVAGLPSGRDSGGLAGAPLVAIAPDGGLAYTAHFNSGSLMSFPASVVESAPTNLPIGPGDLGSTMVPRNEVRLVNPFDLAFARDGSPVATDASENGVATVGEEGEVVFVHRFGQLEAPKGELVEAVPTGIARLGDEYLVTLFGGCPHPRGAGRLVAIDLRRGERVVADGLDMPIDVTVAPDGTVWLLEFGRFDSTASCFDGTGYRAGTGALSRVVDGRIERVVGGLDFPASVVVAPDGTAYVSEVFSGRVISIRESS